MGTPSVDMQLLLFRVRDRVLEVRMSDRFTGHAADRTSHKKLFKQMGNWFPTTKKGERKREIRLGILMALLGSPILSQAEIPAQILYVLNEVTKDASSYLTKELAAEIETTVAGQTYGAAWLLPATDPDSLAMPDLS